MKTLTRKTFLIFLLSFIIAGFVKAQTYKVGDQVQSFELKNVDGKMVKLSDYQNQKGVILVFTCNHCPYSQAYEQRIIELDNKYKNMGYPVIAINPNDSIRQPEDSYSEMIKRSKEYKYTFPYLLDSDQSIAKSFGATRTPHVFLLKNDSKTNSSKLVYIGAIDDNTESADAVKNKYVEKAIDELEQGKTISTTSTKAVGCTIKWAEAK